MKSKPIYIKSLELTNIRTFVGTQVLSFERSDGVIPQWTLLLGDNGIGKTTLLQCVAWMKPSYDPFEETDMDTQFEESDITPIITDEENSTLRRLVHKGKANGRQVTANIKASFVANRKLNESKSSESNEISCESSISIIVKNERLYNVEPSVVPESHDFFSEGNILIYAYSASRQLGKLNLNDPKMEDTIPSLIDEETVLYDAEEILNYLNYASLDDESDRDPYSKLITKIKEMLVSILPEVERVANIEIIVPKLVGNQKQPGGVVVTTKYGTKIPFDDISLGYKTATSWAIDLAWRLFTRYHDSPNPLAEPAIVLIDEIDLHLHPMWQRKIMDDLSKHFKNTQFIATAHSPLMVQAALKSNYAVLKQYKDGVKIINEPKETDGWRVDQILTSELFGLVSSRGIEYEQLYARREELVKKRKLALKEKDELAQINKQLSELPSGERVDEIDNRKLISQIVANIKNKNKEIKL